MAQSGQADEIRPGTYVFSDYMMYKECGAPLENVSARLVVTVVSVHKDYVVVDGGCKTFATDPQLDQPPYFFEGYAWFPQYPELRIRRLTEEHGMVTAEGPMPELKVGDMLEAIPVHICPTVNLQNQIYVADGGVLRPCCGPALQGRRRSCRAGRREYPTARPRRPAPDGSAARTARP